ncbi:MAG: class I SAM-dependent rRNA methyltransferase [Myxococcales bacterium]|nr:class I SAM-dependent rRNA methyltransferase [Myxococcales bacterium]
MFMGHPWVYAQAIARIEGEAAAGDEVTVCDPRGNVLGAGYYSPSSAIPVRLLTREGGRPLDAKFLRARIESALALRRTVLGLGLSPESGYRAVNSEGDALSGLIVDVFGDSAVVQFLTAGMKRRETTLVPLLVELLGVARVYEATSPRHQKLEAITAEDGLLWGDAPGPLTFVEHGVRYELPAPGAEGGGQKTGYYFDQRDNRALVAAMARGKRVLDACSFVGGFALAAAKAGAAEVVAVDSGAAAVATGARLAEANKLDTVRFERSDAKAWMLKHKTRFDVVVLDPPKLAHHGREVEEALGHYRKLNAAAAARVEPGGVLVTCSCSGMVKADEFVRAVAAGVRDAGRDASLVSLRGAAGDHLTPAAFEEGRYLKCAVLTVRA